MKVETTEQTDRLRMANICNRLARMNGIEAFALPSGEIVTTCGAYHADAYRDAIDGLADAFRERCGSGCVTPVSKERFDELMAGK